MPFNFLLLGLALVLFILLLAILDASLTSKFLLLIRGLIPEIIRKQLAKINFLKKLVRGLFSQDLSLISSNMVFFQPYIEHSNLPTLGTDPTEQARAGYSLNRSIYQYRKKEILTHAGERYSHVFQDKLADAHDLEKYRIFFLGGSVAFGHEMTPEQKYYNLLEKKISHVSKNYPVRTIPAALSGFGSTQELVLLNLSVLPAKPDFVVWIDGWNDAVLPIFFSTRPGDTMTMSTMYQKYYNLFFNLRLELNKRSAFLNKRFLKQLKADRDEFVKFFLENEDFRKSVEESVIRIYLSNIDQMMESCLIRGIQVLHVLQPSPDHLLYNASSRPSPEELQNYQEIVQHFPWANLGLEKFIANIYLRLREEIKKRPWHMHSVDLLDQFHLKHFMDTVHLNPEGQEVLAEHLFQSISQRLPTQFPTKSKTNILA